MSGFVIVTEGRGGHDGPGTGGHYGDCARVWASRRGVVSARVVRSEHDFVPGQLNWHSDVVVVEVVLTGEFDPVRDYLVREHRRSPNPHLRGSTARERFELLAGSMPGWALFPGAWRGWVRQVVGEAVCFLEERYPSEVAFAVRKSAKGQKIRAWSRVAEVAGVPCPPASSWTSVEAMTVRIARRLGWRASVRPPRWEDPDGAGRVLVADSGGVVEC